MSDWTSRQTHCTKRRPEKKIHIQLYDKIKQQNRLETVNERKKYIYSTNKKNVTG